MNFGNQQRKNNAADSPWQWSTVVTERIPQEWLVKAGWVVASESTVPNPIDLLDAHAQRLVANGVWSVIPADPPPADEDEKTNWMWHRISGELAVRTNSAWSANGGLPLAGDYVGQVTITLTPDF